MDYLLIIISYLNINDFVLARSI